MAKKKGSAQIMEQQLRVDLIRHMCNWLFEHGFSCTKINIKD
jgi:hypothetical protein